MSEGRRRIRITVEGGEAGMRGVEKVRECMKREMEEGWKGRGVVVVAPLVNRGRQV